MKVVTEGLMSDTLVEWMGRGLFLVLILPLVLVVVVLAMALDRAGLWPKEVS